MGRKMLRMGLATLAVSCWCVSGWSAAVAPQGLPVYNVVNYGAVGDGTTLCTKSIQKAIDECAKHGGGKVVIPPGKFLTGSLYLKNNVTFNIGEGATLLASMNFDDFPPIDTGWRVLSKDIRRSAVVMGFDLENVAVTGRGTINGQGQPWWDALRKDKHRAAGEKPILTHGRPHTVNLYRCKNVLIEDVTIMNSPSWTIHLVGCDDVVVDRVSIENPEGSPNTDGINPESCRNVRISNCSINTNDDCITLKSGKDEEGRTKARPTENIVITNCVMYRGHGAVVVGSEMSGDVRNVTASNIVCVGTDRAVRIKSTRGRGGVVENLRFSNFVAVDVNEPIYITNFYSKSAPEPVSERTPVFRDIAISNFTIKDSPITAKIEGLPEQPIEGIRITDVKASTEKGFLCTDVKGLELHNMDVNVETGPAFYMKNTTDIELDGLKSSKPTGKDPIVRLDNCKNTFIRGCRAFSGTDVFLDVLNSATQNIFMAGNDLSAAAKPYVLGKGVGRDVISEK
ncbi:MAG: glycoside hydrolase family 28 protein [Candidatus Hydrogenedentes bacterium]|nr:glycoside hydrolase family 28 protein [Candidatus Hydrogenedentota bacterium]